MVSGTPNELPYFEPSANGQVARQQARQAENYNNQYLIGPTPQLDYGRSPLLYTGGWKK